MSVDSYRLVFEASHEVSTLAGAQEPASDPAQRGSEFRPVAGGDAMASGETLLIEAYAVLWIILFAFVWISWRRQGRIDARISELAQSLAAARGNQPR